MIAASDSKSMFSSIKYSKLRLEIAQRGEAHVLYA